MSNNSTTNYPALLRQMNQRVALAQQRAIYAANEELLRMYWDLGQLLCQAKNADGWGKGTLSRLSEDMKLHNNTIVQPPVAQLPEYNNRTIGLLLCKTKDKVKAEYALRDIVKPIGISDYELGQALPKDLRSSLPSIEDIEAEFDDKHE